MMDVAQRLHFPSTVCALKILLMMISSHIEGTWS